MSNKSKGLVVQLETRVSFVGVARAGLDQEPWYSQAPGGFERRLLVWGSVNI